MGRGTGKLDIMISKRVVIVNEQKEKKKDLYLFAVKMEQ